MRLGYAPVVVRVDEKEAYYDALRQVDGGDLENFELFLGEQLCRTLEFMIRGAKGGSVDETDDLGRKLKLLRRRLEGGEQSQVKVELTPKRLDEFLDVFFYLSWRICWRCWLRKN